MYTPTPYAGKDKYIFISYSHRDTYQVFPIITKLMENGYRVWFDAGIDPGTEWDENIAQHINECGYFIAFMSSSYLGSNNCKDELNYARDLEKERLIVYLEDVQLPAGLAMRVNRLQSIFKFTYINDDDFYAKLFASKNIDTCCDQNTKTTPARPVNPQTPPVQPVRPHVPPQVQPVNPQTPPVQPVRPHVPPQAQPVKPQTPPVQPMRPHVSPQAQPAKQPTPAGSLQPKTKPDKAAMILTITAIILWVMSLDYPVYDSAVLGMFYCSMIAAGIAIFREQGKGWRVLITVVYFLNVLSVWLVMSDRVSWGYGNEATQYIMVILWVGIYFAFRQAGLKKMKKK